MGKGQRSQTLKYGTILSAPRIGSPIEPGEVIAGKYRVDSILGMGGMGLVVGATDLQLERRIAIKFMRPFEQDDLGMRRFIQEARAAARIQCEHVTRVLDVGSLEDSTPYIVMEYLEGEDLEHVLQNEGKLSTLEAVEYILQACEAIAEAHVAGVIHRDLKPANLFCCRRADGSPLIKVLDFGVSKLLQRPGLPRKSWTTRPRTVVGSPLYLSPEQLRSPHEVDARADIWALGVILYELVTGRPPFLAETFPEICAGILSGSVPPVCALLPDAPSGFDAVIVRSLEKEPAQRFPNVADFAEALMPFARTQAHVSVERIARVVRGREETPPPRNLASSLRSLVSRLEKGVLSPPVVPPSSVGVHSRTFVRTRRVRATRWAIAGGALLAVVLGSTLLAQRESAPLSADDRPEPMGARLPPLPIPIPSLTAEAPAATVPVLSPATSGAAAALPPAQPRPKPTSSVHDASRTAAYGGLL